MKSVMKVLLICFVALTSVNVSAALINGSLAVGGTYDATTASDLSAVTDIGLNTVIANNASGDFLSTIGGPITGTATGVASLDAFAPTVFDFMTIGGWQLDLTSLTVVDRTATMLNLTGSGVLSGNGFEATNATWSFSAENLTSYSMSVTTVVPVPAAVWLFGSGLLGLVAVSRRKA